MSSDESKGMGEEGRRRRGVMITTALLAL